MSFILIEQKMVVDDDDDSDDECYVFVKRMSVHLC